MLNEHHPFYLDDVDNAIYFARGHSKEQIAVDIIGGKTYRAYGDETIIFYSGYQHQGIISDIQIYLSKADRAIDLNQLME